MRNVPPEPELEDEPPQPASARPRMTAPSTPSHVFFICPSFSRVEEGLCERERSPVGVERIPNAERDRGQMLAVAEGQAVENRHAERLQVLLEDVLEGARPGPVRSLALVAPVAVLHLADDDACDPAELPGVTELREHPVDVVGRGLVVLEEEDRPVDVELPGRAHR